MSTAPVVPAATGFWANFKNILPAIELAGNVAISLLVPGGVALAPLLAGLENAVNPLIQSIGTKASVSSEIMTVYATIIGVLTTLKIEGYIVAAQNGTGAYIEAESGFNPALYSPVTPIA